MSLTRKRRPTTLTGMKQNTSRFANINPPRARRHLVSVLAVIGSASLACANDPLDQRDLGNTSGLLTSEPEPDRTPLVGADGEIDRFIEGRWLGHAENPFAASTVDGERPVYAFPSGSTDITLELSLETGLLEGQLVFGSGSVPAPETGVAYPPGFDPQRALGESELQLPPVEGFVNLVDQSTIHFPDGIGGDIPAASYDSNAAYDDWCRLQPPVPTDDGRFECRSDDSDVQELCNASNLCTCTETECRAGESITDLWIVRDGDGLLVVPDRLYLDYGVLIGRTRPAGSVRFERVE